MNRTVVSSIAAFALLVGATLMMTETTAEAGNCGGGGLLAKLHANKCGGGGLLGGGGGLLSKLKSRGCGGAVADPCCAPAPEPCCPEPAPSCGGGGGLLAKLKARRAARKCCAPEPDCCAPAPEPCCAPAPAPCCAPAPAPAPCCGAAAPAPCCGGAGATISYGEAAPASDAGYNLAPGETLVPGSVNTVGAAVESSSDAEVPAPVADDAPPAPTPDAKTDI